MTIADKVLGFVAPHHCYTCGDVGDILCDGCKYYIVTDRHERCLNCGNLATSQSGICATCRPYYERAWFVSERSDSVKRVVDDYKFGNLYAASHVLGDLLHSTLPDLPTNTIFVPIPTIARHVRMRGYDHTLMLAKRFSMLSKRETASVLSRNHQRVQVGAGAKERRNNAKTAFVVNRPIDTNAIYLLVDDVVTTGSTMNYAAKALRMAGVKHVWAASILRQTLD